MGGVQKLFTRQHHLWPGEKGDQQFVFGTAQLDNDLVCGNQLSLAVISDRSIDIQVSRLRRKLGDDPREPRIIKTIWGDGYLFTPDAA